MLSEWPTSGADAWTRTPHDAGLNSWAYSLESGRIDDGAVINAYFYRCVR